MGRTLEFAIATIIIYIMHIATAFFVANIAGMKITSLFNIIIEAFTSII